MSFIALVGVFLVFPSLHCMCFASSSGAIGKDCAIEAFKNLINCAGADCVVNLFLSRSWSKDIVKTVGLFSRSCGRLADHSAGPRGRNLARILIALYDVKMGLESLLGIRWTTTNSDLNVQGTLSSPSILR